MREEEANWFARWEDELPSPEELMPLSQTLITPDLALAFDIPTSSPSPHPPPPPPDFDAAAADDAARTLKRPRLVWTPQLHKRFVDAVAQLGIKTAVPKTIMQLMSVDGLTRENVASHLQKYRLYLKRMKGAAGGSAAGGGISAADHQLFATAAAPVPHHFLNRGAAPAFSPYASALQQQHHQLAAQQYYQQRQAGQFGMPMGGAGFEHAFLARPQLGVHRMLGAAALGMVQTSRSEEQDLVSGGGGRRELTLFPTADV